MKTRKILTILVLAFGLMVWPVKVGEAAPMGTAFIYQGRLIDVNSPANGHYDLQFELYSDPCLSFAAYKVGDTVTIDDLDVIDGYFTVELDFGTWGVFTGDARWLQVGVRPGEMSDPAAYTILSPRQEVTPTPYALYAASGPGVPVPLALSGSVASPGAVISGTNTGSGHGGNFKSTFGTGRGVYGEASNSGYYINYGGYFLAEGSVGKGVYGEAPGFSGTGVWGKAGNTGNYTNFGGFFEAAGTTARGVYGYATHTGNYTNYGGYFEAKGSTGRGVYGEATDIGNVTNYGGYFVARGKYGRAVYGEGTGESGRGVLGETSGKYGIGVQGTAFGDNSFGVYGFTSGSSGRGVCGNASNTGDVENYGGHFVAAGLEGRGVYGKATNTGDAYKPVANYGGYFIAQGFFGQGVYGESTGTLGVGVHGIASGGAGGFGVYGRHTASGNYGYLGGGGRGVYGYSDSGHAGYFSGKVHITGTLSKGGGSFKIDHPLDPENKYLQHSFVESPDMMNVYNGNVLLDEKGQAVVELPEYFEALNRDFRYQLTCIGGFAPVYIAEKISGNHFKIAGGKKGMEISWQVTGIRQDAYAKANRIVVEENKPAEERGYYLHPAAYGLPEEKGIEAVHNARFSETRQVAKQVD